MRPDMISRIGRYTLVKRLAAGGTSDIYLAQIHGRRGYERTVVVKTIRSDLAEDEEYADVLMREARVAALLSHDNIVELIEVGESEGVRFLAMEFVFGLDLGRVRDRCLERRVSIPHDHLTTILADILDALDYAHRGVKGNGAATEVVHRDVSPQNILVGFDGSVRLLDFGLAKAAVQISRTRAGVLKGKYAYMAPEQVRFHEVDGRADIFSVGVVLWEMLTGRRLFLRGNDFETVKAVTQSRAPFARTVERSVPWNLSWVAMRALQRSPRWRYWTAAAMRAALLCGDGRTRQEARNDLSDWMAELFGHRLRHRELVLERLRTNPSRLREVRDAGFELLEDTTDPDVQRPRGRGASSSADGIDGDATQPSMHQVERAASSEDAEPGVRSSEGVSGLAGVLAAAVYGRRMFLGLFLLVVLGGAAVGLALGGRLGPATSHGYIYVFSDAERVRVRVGDRDVGWTPIQRVPVLPGRHRIVGEDETGAQRSVEVVVDPGQNRVIRLLFHGKRG